MRICQQCILLVVITIVAAEPVSHRVTVFYQGKSKNEDVTIDVDQEYAIVTVNPDCNDTQVAGTINYHDYKTGYLAMKNIESKECIVTKNNFNMEDTLRKIQNIRDNINQDLVPFDLDCTKNKPYTALEAREYFGPRIESFCNTYEIIYAESRLAQRGRRHKRSAMWCLVCIGACRGSELANAEEIAAISE